MAPPNNSNRFSPPRDLALRLIQETLEKKKKLTHVLESVSNSGPERAWLRDVCSGMLRNQGRLYWILDQLAEKKKPRGFVRRALALGLFQLMEQDSVDSKKVVFEVVEWIKTREGVPSSRFANALLRNFLRNQERFSEWPTSKKQIQEYSGLPIWIWNRVLGQYGLEWAKAYAEASLQRPRFFGFDVSEQKSVKLESTENLPSSMLVQDISSQTLVSEVSDLFEERPFKVFDLCAAPGGKAIHLAARHFEVSATDVQENRLKRVEENSQRTGVALQRVSYPERKEIMRASDLIWVDAPCSGSGTLRKHPEIRWNRNEQDLFSLVELQQELIGEAWASLSEEKFLVYSVCSVLRDEFDGVLKSLPKEEVEEIKRWVLAPQMEPFGDGFQAICLKKKKASKR